MPDDIHDFAVAVSRLGRRLRQERQSDLTPTQFSVMGTLRVLGPATPTAIARRERVSTPSITRTLNCLTDARLIDRQTDPTDRRQVLITISAEGDRILTEERERRNAWLAARLAELSDEEHGILMGAAALMTEIATS